MDFYPAKNHDRYYDRLFLPDRITQRAMINPHYPIDVLHPLARVIIDSGAFQDNGIKRPRVSPAVALNRQLALESRLRHHLGPAWHSEALVTYDYVLGVDEAVITIERNGRIEQRQVKTRGNEETARIAIAQTLESARYYASQRHRIQGTIAFAAQGINPRQYRDDCVVPLLDLMQPGDWLAFGGFCIIGKVPSLKPVFYETLQQCIPLAKRRGITRFHILGVTVRDAIQIAAGIAKKYNVTISTDSSSIEVNSLYGKTMDSTSGTWTKVYTKAQKLIAYHPCNLAHANIRAYRDWCAQLAIQPDTPLYAAYANRRDRELRFDLFDLCQ